MPVEAAATRPLRQRILRPGQTVNAVAFPGDGAPASAHFGARLPSGKLLGVASVLREPAPWDRRTPGWRVRGMATVPEARRHGLGSRLLAAVLAHVETHGGGLLWCHARTPAVSFYERAGFVTRGTPWDELDIGPHITMWRRVDSRAPSSTPALTVTPGST